MVTGLDKKTALILIDLQKGILQYAPANLLQDVLQNVAKLVDAFHKAKLPVVVVNVDASGAAWTKSRKDAKQPLRVVTPESLEIVPEVLTQPEDIFITKHTWNAFHETTLHEELQKLGITGIVIGGVSTSIGVEGTARAASERAYNITFAKDAMTDTVPAAHENSLTNIFPRMGEVDNTDAIVKMLTKF